MNSTTNSTTIERKARIYVFKKRMTQDGFAVACALAEDGTLLSISQCALFSIRSDMGAGGRKADIYAQHYGAGFKVEVLTDDETKTHEGFILALSKNKARAAEKMVYAVDEA